VQDKTDSLLAGFPAQIMRHQIMYFGSVDIF